MVLLRVLRFIFSLMVAAALVSGCGSTGSVYREHREIAPGKAQIVVFRPDKMFQGGIPYLVKINGSEVAVLRNGGFCVADVEPGTVLIELSGTNLMQRLRGNPSIGIAPVANERVFVRATPDLGTTVTLGVVSTGGAMPELRSLKESQ